MNLIFDCFFLFYSSSLHNYSTRRDSLDFRVVDIPKLLTKTCQYHDDRPDQLRMRIHQLESELNFLKSKLI